jgi:hypothetical protein
VSRGDSNWCTLCRGNPDQYATRFQHLVRVWFLIIRISCGPRIATFHEVVNSGGQSHYSREKGLPTQSTARRLTDLWIRTQFLSQDNHWSCGGKTTLCWRQATRLTGPIYQHAIGTFNTCLWGLTHRSLNNTGGGYNLGGADFPYTTPRPSQPTVSTFHLRVPPDLQFNHIPPV